MKIILLLLALLVGPHLFAQVTIGESYIFTKEQHDQIKKNLDDYRDLIKKFNKLNSDFIMLTEQYELAKAIKNHQEITIKELKLELTQYKTETHDYESLKIQHENLKLNYEKLQSEILSLNSQLQRSSKNVNYWSKKYERELRYDRGDRIMAGVVGGSLIGAALLIIYQDLVTHYLHHN